MFGREKGKSSGVCGLPNSRHAALPRDTGRQLFHSRLITSSAELAFMEYI